MTQTTRRASFTVIRPLDRHLAAREAAVGAHLVEIVVQGRLSPSLVAALEGFTVEDAGPGVTRVTGFVPDQSMLFGILDMLDGLHIEVVSVNRVDANKVFSSVPNDARARLRP